MSFSEINHKINMKVKTDCKVIIIPLLQSMLGFRQAILSLPSIGTILNNGTWASPTILGSTKGQYTYREFNPFLTSTTQSETYSPAGNIAYLNRVFDPIQYCPLLQRRFQTVEIDIRDDTGSIVPFERGRVVVLHVPFPLDGESFWPRNSTHPVTSPNAFIVLTPCKSEPSTRLRYS
jgi:hypothetical protein